MRGEEESEEVSQGSRGVQVESRGEQGTGKGENTYARTGKGES